MTNQNEITHLLLPPIILFIGLIGNGFGLRILLTKRLRKPENRPYFYLLLIRKSRKKILGLV